MQKPGFLFFVLLLMLLTAFPAVLLSQTAVLKGFVENEKGKPAELVNVQLVGTKRGMTTNQKGFFQLQVPAGRDLHIAISYIGYRRQDTVLRLNPGEVKILHFQLRRITTNLPGFVVRDRQLRTESIVRLNPRDARERRRRGRACEISLGGRRSPRQHIAPLLARSPARPSRLRAAR